MPIPHWFVSCGQRINAFRVHAFVMSSASGSVPLVPYLPSKGVLFRSAFSCQKDSALHSWGRAQDRGPLCLLRCPRKMSFQQPRCGCREKTGPWQSKRSLYGRQNPGSGIPQTGVQVPLLMLSSSVVLCKPSNLPKSSK